MSYVDEIIDLVVEKNPAQPEFHQAVKEVLESLRVVVEAHEEEYRRDALLERMVNPERQIIFRVPWVDDNGTVQVNFTSTIGNKNYLSAMITVALPFSVGLAVATQDKVLRILAYVSTGLQFMGLLVATSDGGFLGCFAAFAVMLVIVSRDMKKLSKFFFCLAIMMASAKLLWLFDLIMKGNILLIIMY